MRVLLWRLRAPSGLPGVLFTHRDTHTPLWIWAGPLTSTEKGFLQGCLAANCWVDWQAAQMKEKSARTLPPLPFSPAPHPRAPGQSRDLRPQSPPSFPCPQRLLGRQGPHPSLVGLARAI